MSRVALALLLVLPSLASAQDGRAIMQEVQQRSKSESQQYEGTLSVSGGGSRVSTKRWVFRRLGSFGRSKSLLRFTAPAEVKGVALLIVNHENRASDQWMWRPAIGRDRRIAVQDRSTRFFGTDFSFEDLEERDIGQFDFKVLAEENGNWKIEAHPLKASQYTHSYLWIRKETYTVVRSEAYNKSGLVRTIEYRDFEWIGGIWTARTVEVTDVPRKSHTTLKYDTLQYNVPMKDDEFTVQALRRES